MIQTNTLPNILDAYGSYSIELAEIGASTIDVNFIIEYNNMYRQHTITHKVFNDTTSIRLDSILKSIFDFEPYEFNQFKPLANLTIQIADFNKKFKVVKSALQFGTGQTMDDFVNKRLGYTEKSPLFLGYPKVTSVLRTEGIEMVNNSKGCPFDESEIDSTVHIKVELPNGQIVEVDNLYELDIPDVNDSNGVYTVTYTTNAGDELIREFRVVNAGAEVVPPTSELDLVFMRQSEDVGNEYEFMQESFRDSIKVLLEVDFPTDSNTQYRFKITTPSNEVYQTNFEYRNWISLNPYINSTPDSFKVTELGIHTVEAWILHEGQELHHTESFEVISIQRTEQSEQGQITVLQEMGEFTPPMIMGDNIVVRQFNGNPFRLLLQDTNYTGSVNWELTYPNQNIQTLNNDFVRLMYSPEEPYDFEITQSGEYKVKANFDGQFLERTLNITVQ